MPLYYFHINNDDVTEDFEGTELADDAAARAYAIAAARALAAETVHMGHLGLSHRIEVESADREKVMTVTFAEAVEIRP
ncbi:MAG TPA: hypothetical protein VGB60_07220 [Brevundimonas sp.]|uniref:DUF6894 family protein n=1 Tax=Brevundimonas sp. TaxID=1871086 RepID=UPI002EDAD098